MIDIKSQAYKDIIELYSFGKALDLDSIVIAEAMKEVHFDLIAAKGTLHEVCRERKSDKAYYGDLLNNIRLWYKEN